MVTADATVDEIDRLTRWLLRDTECCDRVLVARRQLTLSQAHTLLALEDRGEITMNGLAEEMRLHGTTMTRTVDTLVDRALVERVANPSDRRVVRVRLTEAGRVFVADLRRLKRDLLGPSLSALPRKDLAAMEESLRHLASFAEQWAANCTRSGENEPD